MLAGIDRRTANLGDEAEPLICRESTAYFVRLDDKPNAELPDMQIPITANHEEWKDEKELGKGSG